IYSSRHVTNKFVTTWLFPEEEIMKSRHCQLLLVCACLLWWATTVRAQVAVHGKITGVITDAAGAAVPGATVMVEGPTLMGKREARTLESGAYLFEALPPGAYDLTVSMRGFKTALRKGIVVSAGFTATVNFALEIGEIETTVTVSAAPPVVDVKGVSNATSF